MESLMLRRVRVIGDGRLVDIAIDRGHITAVGRALDPMPGANQIDLDGRWVMPGLWDAHVHFTQWARFLARIDVSGTSSAAEAVQRLVAANPQDALIVGRGFQDALWSDAPTAQALDLAFPGRSVMVVSHDLHSVWLSSAAAARFGAPSAGLLREADAFAIQVALGKVAGDDTALVRAAAQRAAARGVVGIHDLEMADNVAVWQGRVLAGLRTLRVHAGIYPEHLDASDQRGWVGGSVVPGTDGRVVVGALKVFSDGSLNTRTALTYEPYGTDASVGHAAHSPRELANLLREARARRLEVALHAIGDLAVTRALDAFEASGARGSIEHAQLIRAADLPRFARLRIIASVQPQHAIDDREVTDAVWADRAERAFAYRHLLDAGAQLWLGSDAPVAPLDPWVTMAAAVSRTDDEQDSWHAEQELPREAALRASTRRLHGVWLVPGMPGDVIAMETDPYEATAPQLRQMSVALTVVGGSVTHSTLS